MSIQIEEIDSKLPKLNPIKENMSIYIEGIPKCIPCSNGFVWVLCGSGGSGKSSLLYSMFKNKDYFRGKFENIYLFQPSTSYMSVKNHPFDRHAKVFHDLDVETLEEINDELIEIKEECLENDWQPEHALIIIDDYANALKDKDIMKMLNKLIIKTRHINCSWIITLQSFKYCPLILRKQITFLTIFKPKSLQEWNNICQEMFAIDKNKTQAIYDYVFNEPYTHIDYDIRNGKLYKNFNELIIK